jgi:Tfp pilus assembly protein PilF
VEELLTQAITTDQKSYTALLYLGRLIVGRGGDLERADWAFKKAAKLDERAAMPLVERARVLVRRNELAEAAQLLDKAVRLEPSCHGAFFVRGELAWAQGNPFLALAEFQKAVERSPKGARVRAEYEEGVTRMRALIESGAYADLQRAAEATAESAEGAAPEAGQRREPGKTVQRRRRGGRGRGGAGEAGTAAEGAEAVATDVVSTDAVEAVEIAEAVAEAVVESVTTDEPASAE